MKKSDVDRAVEKIDKYDEGLAGKKEDNVIVCPKCKSLVDEQDFTQDKLADMAETSLESKINCPKCGYVGMPVEIDRREFSKFKKSKK